MACTPSQEKLIGRLQELGAVIPCKGGGDGPDFSMLDSEAQADDYIKQWRHLLPSVPATKLRAAHMRADEWGGIPNC